MRLRGQLGIGRVLETLLNACEIERHGARRKNRPETSLDVDGSVGRAVGLTAKCDSRPRSSM
jgi:hypothetical protein